MEYTRADTTSRLASIPVAGSCDPAPLALPVLTVRAPKRPRPTSLETGKDGQPSDKLALKVSLPDPTLCEECRYGLIHWHCPICRRSVDELGPCWMCLRGPGIGYALQQLGALLFCVAVWGTLAALIVFATP